VRARGWAAAGLLPLVCAAASTLGAARARLGGTLSVGLVGLQAPGVEGAVDSPEADTLRALLALPVCRLLPGPVPVLASVARAEGAKEEVLLTPLPGARFADGSALSSRDVALAWKRLSTGASPYASLLAPVGHLEEALDAALQHPEAPLRLRLQYPWPDFEASLCHPAFTPLRAVAGGAALEGVGLYGPLSEGRAPARAAVPRGPPFPSGLSLSPLQARAAGRLLLRGEVHLLLGEPSAKEAAPLRFATYLVYRPEGLPQGVLSALARVDVQALVRTFVPGPAAPLRGLLPEVQAEPSTVAKRPKAPATPAAGRSFALGYEVGLPEQKAVAERLQVLLHDAGYAVRLVGDGREALSRARQTGDVPMALVSVLLPPLPAPALAVVLGLLGDNGLLARELPPLGAVEEAQARSAQVAARARELLGEVALYPLYVRGLRVQLSEALVDVRRDAFGLLVLDEAWLVR
jgi:peptide/nickel transport system substrate-binding protein